MPHQSEYERRVALRTALKELPGNPAWAAFADKLRKLAVSEAEQHESEALTPERRAEHLHSMKLLRELDGWLAKTAADTERALRERRE